MKRFESKGVVVTGAGRGIVPNVLGEPLVPSAVR